MRNSGTIARTMRDDVRRWIFPLAMIALWCAPAIAINVTHGLQAGREPALIVAAVFSVFGAAMCGLRLERQGPFAGKLLAAACLAVLLSFNFSNAIGLSAGSRDHARGEALTAQTARQSLGDDSRALTATINRLSGELDTSSLSSLKSEIAAAEYSPLFSRSRKCTDATVAESRAHCAAWEKARAMLVAAEQRDKLQGELTAINAQLRAAPVRESVDPQAEAIVQALAFAGLAVQPRDVGYGLVLLFALGIELMAAFGASWCGVQLPGVHQAPTERTRAAGTARRSDAAPNIPAAATAQPGDPLAAFVGELVESRQPMPFAELHEAYANRCKAAGKPPKSPRALGLALTGAGFAKSKADGGKIHYGARLRKGLAVVAA